MSIELPGRPAPRGSDRRVLFRGSFSAGQRTPAFLDLRFLFGHGLRVLLSQQVIWHTLRVGAHGQG